MNEGTGLDANGDVVTYHYPILNCEFGLLFAKNQYYDVVTLNFAGVYYIDGSGQRVDIANTNNYTFATDGTYVHYVVIEYTISHTGKDDIYGVVSGAGSVYYDTGADSQYSASDIGEYKVRVYLNGDLITFGVIKTNANVSKGTDAKGEYVEFTWSLANM
jgi:hypothetical protein